VYQSRRVNSIVGSILPAEIRWRLRPPAHGLGLCQWQLRHRGRLLAESVQAMAVDADLYKRDNRLPTTDGKARHQNMADTGEDREIKQRVNAHQKEAVREMKELVRTANAGSAKSKGRSRSTSQPKTKLRIPRDSHGAA